MSVSIVDDVIKLEGSCGADDVEALISALDKSVSKSIDFSNADHLHGAVLQTLLAFTPEVLGSPRDSFVRTWLIPVLQEARRVSELAGGKSNQPHLLHRRSIE
jgi:hypothetical protein